jgi:hypothetical protein
VNVVTADAGGIGRRLRILRGCLTALLLTILVLAGAAGTCSPAGAEAGEPVYGVDETVRLRVDAVGDVDHEYVLVYDQEFFAEQGASFEEYPFLLVRRYRAREAVDEIEGLKADLDREAGRVTLSFREPGRAYNMGDHWVLYGLGGPPDEVVDGVAVLREDSTENNDFTLWQDLAFATTTEVSLPEGAEHVRWDEAELALVWQTPEQVAAYEDEGSVLQRYRVPFALLFSALMAVSLVVLIQALTRGGRGQVA